MTDAKSKFNHQHIKRQERRSKWRIYFVPISFFRQKDFLMDDLFIA